MASILQQLYPFAALYGQYEMGRRGQKLRGQELEETKRSNIAQEGLKGQEIEATEIASYISLIIASQNMDIAVLNAEVERFKATTGLTEEEIRSKALIVVQRIASSPDAVVALARASAEEQRKTWGVMEPTERYGVQVLGAARAGKEIPSPPGEDITRRPEFLRASQLSQWVQQFPIGHPTRDKYDEMVGRLTGGSFRFEKAGLSPLLRFDAEAQVAFPEAPVWGATSGSEVADTSKAQSIEELMKSVEAPRTEAGAISLPQIEGGELTATRSNPMIDRLISILAPKIEEKLMRRAMQQPTLNPAAAAMFPNVSTALTPRLR